MNNIKTFKEFNSINENFIINNKIGDLISSSVSLLIKKFISKKTEEERLIIFEKLLKFSNALFDKKINIYSFYVLLTSIGLDFLVKIFKLDFPHDTQWIFIITFWIILLSKFQFRKKILDLISKSKNEYLKNKISDLQRIIDPLGEEVWDDKDLILKKINCLEKNCFLYDIEFSCKNENEIISEYDYRGYVRDIKFLFNYLSNNRDFDFILENNKIIVKNVEISLINRKENMENIKNIMKNNRFLSNFNIKYIKK